MSFYIFVNSDGYDLNDKKVRSKQIALYRITNKTYPLYKNTRNANSIKKDDFFIFYLAGSSSVDSKKFIAYGRVESVLTNKNYSEHDVHLSQPIEKAVKLKSVKSSSSVNIYDVKDKLEFISQKEKWGSSMQGGVIKIPEKDYNLIIQSFN